MIASIPSPTSDSLNIGPLHLRFYGLMIALGVIAAVMLARRLLARKGADPELIVDLAMWAVPAGLIGTRIYHVVTDYSTTYCGLPGCPKAVFWDAFKIWEGGLGIPGGIAAGFLVGWWYCRRKKIDIKLIMDVVAPALPLAQAIGRFGNYFNQELFGRPTSLPWGLRITNPARLFEAQQKYPGATVFHPTFLYESLWNLGVMTVLLLMDRTGKLRRGKLFPAYIGLYFLGRMWVEELRIDKAAHVGGLRWNFLLSVIMIVVGLVWFLWGGFRATPEEQTEYAAMAAAGPGGGSAEAEEGVAEGGPEVDGPGSEVDVAEPDGGEVAVGVDPAEGAAGTEVAEGPD